MRGGEREGERERGGEGWVWEQKKVELLFVCVCAGGEARSGT